jgi:serine/threonine protein kinase
MQLLAIEHVHNHNILHGAVKERNVFIDTDGHIVLGDFGETRTWLHTDPRHQFTCGCQGVVTPAFSSDRDHEDRYEADFRAFGLMLYKMLSGKVSGRHLHLSSCPLFNYLGGI